VERTLLLLSVPAAVLPVLGFLGLMWWLDRHDREPLGLFFLTFLWGAVGAILLAGEGLAATELAFARSLGAVPADRIAAVLLAPLFEEPSKAAALLLVARSRHFDNTTDGFVYGAAAGLGFGMSENLVYFVSLARDGDALAWAGTVAARSLFATLLHGASTSAVGAGLGLFRFHRSRLRWLAPAAGFAIAFGMHALWNGLIYAAGQGSLWLGYLDLALFPIEFLILFGIFQLSLLDEAAVLRRELAEEAEAGTLPREHVRFLSSFRHRHAGRWAPPGLDVHAYVRAATTLALRRHQARLLRETGDAMGGGRPSPRHDREREAEAARAELGRLLAALSLPEAAAATGPRPSAPVPAQPPDALAQSARQALPRKR
jgi:RsiW-degrading membrane proteinase PrsW (M82 family)